MSNQFDTIEAEALKVSPEARAQLADRLIASLFEDHAIEDDGAAEVERRGEEIEGGPCQADSGSRLYRPGPRRDHMIASASPEADRELTEGAVFHVVRGEELGVIALAHHRGRPGYWGGRK